jgi:hypothetical protein
MHRTRFAAFAALLSSSLIAAPRVHAQPAADAKPSEADLAAAKERYAEGKTKFDAKDFAGAVEAFKESYRLSKNPLLLYNIGFTLDQMAERPMALFYYQKYVAAAPAGDGNAKLARERIDALMREIEQASLDAPATSAPAAPTAGGEAAATAATGPARAADPATKTVTKFEHAVIDAAPPGKPIDIGAFVPGSLQVQLFYRAAGEAKFHSVPMKARYNERVARIPAGKTKAGSVQYYIEARDGSGKLIARSGKPTSPNIVFVEAGAAPHYYADLGDAASFHADEGNAEETTPTSSGDGWLDAGSGKFKALKWGTTGSAIGFLALSATFYFVAKDAGASLEDEASGSISDDCPEGPPCRSFSGDQQSLEGRGERFETMANVALGVGAVSAVAAGIFWYLDIKDRRARAAGRAGAPADEPKGVSYGAVLTPDYVGGAAAVRF